MHRGDGGPRQAKAPPGEALTVALRAHNAHKLRRRQGIRAILRRREAERLLVELFEWVVDEGIRGTLTEDRASAIVDGIKAANADWLRATGGDRLSSLPTRAIAGRGR